MVTPGVAGLFPARTYNRTMARKFAPLSHVPDHPALEREVLERWERERTFDRLREQNAGGPRFSFVDGPITANNPMGVHHAWGRALKDVFQRYKAAARARPALPERLRLPGALGRGRGREVARAQLQARDRGVRPGRVRRPLPRARRRVRRGDHRAVEAARDVDGLGQRLLHLLGHEHRVHLAVPPGGPPPRLAASWATARPSGARAAEPRSRSTSRPARGTTRSSTIRRSTCVSRCATATGERSWSGRRRHGRCPRTSPRR